MHMDIIVSRHENCFINYFFPVNLALCQCFPNTDHYLQLTTSANVHVMLLSLKLDYRQAKAVIQAQ